MTRIQVRATLLLAVLGVGAIALYDLVSDAAVQSLVYEGLGSAAAVSVALRAQRLTGPARLGLRLVAAGILSWVAGDVVSDGFAAGPFGAVAYPSWADVLYLAGYALAIGGLAHAARGALGRLPALPLVDGAIATATFFVIAWVGLALATKSVASAGASLGVLTYPTLDVLVLAVGVRLFGDTLRTHRALWLVVGGLVALLAADAAYAVDVLSYRIGGRLDDGWLLAYLCFALAARAGDGIRFAAAAEQLRLRPGRLVTVALALVATPVAAAIGSHGSDTAVDALLAAVPAAALAGLVIMRMAIILRAHDRARLVAQDARVATEAARAALAAEQTRLAESELRFRQIFDHAGLAIALVDDTRRIVATNHRFARLFGYTQDEAVGRAAETLTHTDDIAADAGRFGELFDAGRQPYTTEKRYVRKDGSVFRGRLTYSPACAEDGSVAFAIAIVEDVTVIHETQRALRASERRLDRMFEQARTAMAVTNAKGRWVRANRALCELLGYPQEELLAMSFSDVTHPDDLGENLAALRELVAGRLASFEAEKRYVRRDGGVVDVVITVTTITDHATGELLFSSQIQDVTARNEALAALSESERRLRAIVEHSVEGIVVLDDERRIQTVNPAACAIAAHAEHELLGVRVDGLLDVPAETVSRAWSRGAMPAGAAWALRRPDGSRVALEIDAVAGVLPGRHLVMLRDISERLAFEAERERLERERRIAQRLEAVGQLAAGIAHEINTPVQFIGNSVEFIGQGFDDVQTVLAAHRALREAVRAGASDVLRLAAAACEAEEDADLDYLQARVPSAVQRTHEGVERISTIVAAMRDFGHTATSEHQLADLNKTLETALIIARNEYKYVAEVETDFGDIPLVPCDAGELGQVFLNLIVNAAHAIAAAGRQDEDERGTIRIQTRQERDALLVTVSDTGTGIPAELQERIFDPFFTTKPVGTGTGQGLAISRSIIVDHHGGALTVESEPGAGAAFRISLPLAPLEDGRRHRTGRHQV